MNTNLQFRLYKLFILCEEFLVGNCWSVFVTKELTLHVPCMVVSVCRFFSDSSQIFRVGQFSSNNLLHLSFSRIRFLFPRRFVSDKGIRNNRGSQGFLVRVELQLGCIEEFLARVRK